MTPGPSSALPCCRLDSMCIHTRARKLSSGGQSQDMCIGAWRTGIRHNHFSGPRHLISRFFRGGASSFFQPRSRRTDSCGSEEGRDGSRLLKSCTSKSVGAVGRIPFGDESCLLGGKLRGKINLFVLKAAPTLQRVPINKLRRVRTEIQNSRTAETDFPYCALASQPEEQHPVIHRHSPERARTW